MLRTPAVRPDPYEVACEYDPADPLAVEYADFCRTAAPPTWAAAGMMTPLFGSLRVRG